MICSRSRDGLSNRLDLFRRRRIVRSIPATCSSISAKHRCRTAIFLLGFLVIYRAIKSPFGEVLKSIRENEQRAICSATRPTSTSCSRSSLSGTLAGLAGAVKVFAAQNASLTDVHWTMSGEVVLMTLVGGLGTVFGPVVGAFVIIAMQQYLAGFGQWVTVIQGAIFVICVLTFPPRRRRRNRPLFQAIAAVVVPAISRRPQVVVVTWLGIAICRALS